MKAVHLASFTALLALLLAGPAEASFPSVLDGRFPVDSSQFPGQGPCQPDGSSGVAMTPFGWYAPPCQIDPNTFFAGNPQFAHVVLNVQSSPVFMPAGPVPEPGAFALLIAGLAGLGWVGRRPRRR
jgi:hypothetical protein